VAHRQAHFGPNRLMLKKDKSTLILFMSQFHQPLIYILLAATVVMFTLQEWVDRGVIFGVVLDIGEVFWQNSRRWNIARG
jgi:cation-transporting P-type ATPase F